MFTEAAGMALNAVAENVADPAISQSITEALRVTIKTRKRERHAVPAVN